MEDCGLLVPMFRDKWGASGEGKGTADGISVGDRARDVVRVVVEVGGLFVAASCASGFSGDDVACFVTFDTQCEFKRKKYGLGCREDLGMYERVPCLSRLASSAIYDCSHR